MIIISYCTVPAVPAAGTIIPAGTTTTTAGTGTGTGMVWYLRAGRYWYQVPYHTLCFTKSSNQ